MPYFKCNKCHHEWESADRDSECDWCGGEGEILEQQTPLEKMIYGILDEDDGYPD